VRPRCRCRRSSALASIFAGKSRHHPRTDATTMGKRRPPPATLAARNTNPLPRSSAFRFSWENGEAVSAKAATTLAGVAGARWWCAWGKSDSVRRNQTPIRNRALALAPSRHPSRGWLGKDCSQPCRASRRRQAATSRTAPRRAQVRAGIALSGRAVHRARRRQRLAVVPAEIPTLQKRRGGHNSSRCKTTLDNHG
jgi:hypothetical protein